MLLAQELQKLQLSGEAFNFSNEHPIPVIKLVKEIYRISRQKPNYKILNQTKYEIKHQYLSSSKAKMILDWKPKHDLKEGLIKTIQWYKDVLNR
jgi:CDP-glucose 4,6-dehydratase